MSKKPTVLNLCETWLTHKKPQEKYKIESFTLIQVINRKKLWVVASLCSKQIGKTSNRYQ